MTLRISSAFSPYSKEHTRVPPRENSPYEVFRKTRVYFQHSLFHKKLNDYKIGAVLKNSLGHECKGSSKSAYAVGIDPHLIAVVTNVQKWTCPEDIAFLIKTAERERLLLNSLHEVSHLAKLRDAFSIPKQMYVLILDHVGPTLSEGLISNASSLSNEHLERNMKKYAGAIAALHREGILHGDVSSNNVSLDGRLFDLGLSENIGEEVTPSPKYAQEYRPPETVYYGSILKSDIWALGALYFEMVFKEFFTPVSTKRAETPEEEFQEDLNLLHAYEQRLCMKWNKAVGKEFFDGDQLKPSTAPPLPPLKEKLALLPKHPKINALADLLIKMLDPRPMQRLSAEEVLNHTFFKKNRYDYAVRFSADKDLSVQVFSEKKSLGTFLIPSSKSFHLPARASYRLEVWSFFKQNELIGTGRVSLIKDGETIRISTNPFSISLGNQKQSEYECKESK